MITRRIWQWLHLSRRCPAWVLTSKITTGRDEGWEMSWEQEGSAKRGSRLERRSGGGMEEDGERNYEGVVWFQDALQLRRVKMQMRHERNQTHPDSPVLSFHNHLCFSLNESSMSRLCILFCCWRSHSSAASPPSCPHPSCLLVPRVVILIWAAVNHLHAVISCCQTGFAWSQSSCEEQLVVSLVICCPLFYSYFRILLLLQRSVFAHWGI